MDINVDYKNENVVLCTIPKAEELKQCSTIGRLLNELQIILQTELEQNPASEATTDFKKNLEILEKAYKEEIPKIVDDYQKEYPSFIREKLPKVEEQYKKLVNWSDDVDNPGDKYRKAITELRDKFYNHVEDCLKVEWDNARKEFKNGKCCRDQALELKKITEKEFEHYKKFKETAIHCFKQLDDIYKKAEVLLDIENYKALYAYRLEFYSILHEVRQLKKNETKRPTQSSSVVKDHEWLKSLLTGCLRNYCLATYEYFYWHNNWIDLIEQEKKAAQNYQNFKDSRMDKFIREAQDVTLPSDEQVCYDEPYQQPYPHPKNTAI